MVNFSFVIHFQKFVVILWNISVFLLVMKITLLLASHLLLEEFLLYCQNLWIYYLPRLFFSSEIISGSVGLHNNVHLLLLI